MNYLDRFFNEKEIEYKRWELEDKNGMTHWINNEVVIEFIKQDEKNYDKYREVLSGIDFVNGDVNDFLKHIAKKIINLNGGLQ